MARAPGLAVELPKTLHSAVTLGGYILGKKILLPKLPCLFFFCLNIIESPNSKSRLSLTVSVLAASSTCGAGSASFSSGASDSLDKIIFNIN
jgi:hypothetical protein